jgi:hypothetical protein
LLGAVTAGREAGKSMNSSVCSVAKDELRGLSIKRQGLALAADEFLAELLGKLL